MTLEWAGISFEQGVWQYIHRIAMASGEISFIPLLSGNAGNMVAENLDRFRLRGAVGNVDPLMVRLIDDAEQFVEYFRPMSKCNTGNDILQSPSVVHFFGHHKNNHLVLRDIIVLRMIQYVTSDCKSHLQIFQYFVTESFVDIFT